MNELGYIATEKGRTFPDEPTELKDLLKKYDIVLASQFVSVMFSRKNLYKQEMEKFKENALFLKDMGCNYVIVCDMGGSTLQDNTETAKKLAGEEWDLLVCNSNKSGKFWGENGFELGMHPHAGTVVEQKEDVDHSMEKTDSRY